MNNRLSVDTDALLTAYDHGQLRYAVAYGSGAVRQESYKPDDKRMLDMILAVDDPKEWHAGNIAEHPQDYSLLRLLGPQAVSAVQEWGAGVYYNPYVRFGEHEIKYGVISTRRLIDDLLHWNDLYAAGRLQKPVEGLRSDERIAKAQQSNLASAVAAARLLLPETFTEHELFCTIAGLSYGGDIRMGVGEHPHKVANIVNGSLPQFRTLYADTLNQSPELAPHDADYRQGQRADVRSLLIAQLPKSVSAQPGMHADAEVTQQQQALRAHLGTIVGGSSLVMTLKGILTAGPIRSLHYVAAKLGKRWKSFQAFP